MSRILIIGGHGKIALLLAPLLAARGDEVTSVVRNPDHVDDVHAAGATALVLDVAAADTTTLSDALAGNDAVVWSAGAGGGDAARTYAVDRDAAIRAMDAAEVSGASRFVMVSWIGSSPDHGIDPSDSFFPYADAKLAADEHLRRSSLEWTVLGPGTLTSDDATGRITTEPTGRGEISRADVAQVIAATLGDAATIHRTIRFGAGATPISEALSA
ncbi:SDR family oxidoreductase [Microbacterium sp. RG1]|uniref:SDR family oxidoreductase n=1 Tax=Microbacterium sp. RG1 TaxID=2489212 RepID=UPI0010CA60E2|nr:SDR family oxidoreductase [Microbacterium sp. RG1]QCQ15803.1 SDR family oxidoreductase [Microbacterium sp. RG1]